MSMPNFFSGRSRMCPLLAATSKSPPRYLPIVLALAGDSTITRPFLDERLGLLMGFSGLPDFLVGFFFIIVLGVAIVGASYSLVLLSLGASAGYFQGRSPQSPLI